MRSIILVAGAVAVLASMTVSCKNRSKTPEQELESATELTDSVVAKVDSMFSLYIENSVNVQPLDVVLTEADKAVKPSGFFDLKAVDTLSTTSQKTSALAFIIIDDIVKRAYGLKDDTESVKNRLLAEFNLPESLFSSDSISVSQRKTYDYCKENGMLDYISRFEYSLLIETSNILANNPGPYLSKMTPSDLATFENSWTNLEDAIAILAKYNSNTAQLYDIMINYSALVKPEGGLSEFSSIEDAKASYAAAKPKFETIRTKLLQ